MKKVKLICTQCKKKFYRLKKQHDFAMKSGSKKICCSQTCFSLSTRNRRLIECHFCGKKVYRPVSKAVRSKSGLYFCSKPCANGINNRIRSGKNHPMWANGKSSYRERAFKHYGKTCQICGYDIVAVLEVHHRDGNREHNEIYNLDVLCPTHHNEYEFGIRTYEILPDSVIDNTFGSEPKESRFKS